MPLTTLARSSPAMLGAARAAASAWVKWASVSDAPTSSVKMQPFCAPVVRSRRVNRRVSMLAMATVPSRCKYCGSVSVIRKFDGRIGRSLMIRPAA